jgi:hypothetical protein
MVDSKKFKEVKVPTVSARHLADYMAASERARRSIIAGCKYRPIARIIQHNEAKAVVANWERASRPEGHLIKRADALSAKFAHDQFDRDLLDHNADYIRRYDKVSGNVILPNAESLTPPKFDPLVLNGVRVSFSPNFFFRRTTKTNAVRLGAGTLRYEKFKKVNPEAARYQSAFAVGYLNQHGDHFGADADPKLCIIVDAWAGEVIAAPGDAVTRFKNMEAACKTIAEWWPNIEAPSPAKSL